MKNLIVLAALLLMTNLFAQSPYRNIMITDDNTPSEVTIAHNPINPLNLVAAANIESYFYSFDGGYTWQTRILESTYGVYGDPCIVADVRGNFYYFHLSNSYTEGGKWLDRIICQKSDDGGISWTNGTFMGANPPHLQDKEWAAIDVSYSPYRNNIYAAWTQCGQNKYGDEGSALNPVDSASNIIFSYSTDGGETWSAGIKIGTP